MNRHFSRVPVPAALLLAVFLAKILSGREINSFERFPQPRFCYNRSPCSASSHSSSEPSFASCTVDKVCC